MPACKACGEWFAKTNPHEELWLQMRVFIVPTVRLRCPRKRIDSFAGRAIRIRPAHNGRPQSVQRTDCKAQKLGFIGE